MSYRFDSSVYSGQLGNPAHVPVVGMYRVCLFTQLFRVERYRIQTGLIALLQRYVSSLSTTSCRGTVGYHFRIRQGSPFGSLSDQPVSCYHQLEPRYDRVDHSECHKDSNGHPFL